MVFSLVSAHKVEVTAESIPPEIPITRTLLYSLAYFFDPINNMSFNISHN